MNKIPTLSSLDAASAASLSTQTDAAQKAKDLSTRDVKTEKEANKAAGGFEALLLHEMMQSMWSTVEFSPMFNEQSNESQIYRDMFTQAIADNSSAGKGIGVKQFVAKELLKKSHASK